MLATTDTPAPAFAITSRTGRIVGILIRESEVTRALIAQVNLLAVFTQAIALTVALAFGAGRIVIHLVGELEIAAALTTLVNLLVAVVAPAPGSGVAMEAERIVFAGARVSNPTWLCFKLAAGASRNRVMVCAVPHNRFLYLGWKNPLIASTLLSLSLSRTGSATFDSSLTG